MRGEGNINVVDRIIKCRHEISKWRKDNLFYGRKRISELQKLVEECQMDDTRSLQELMYATQQLNEPYKDEEKYWHKKSRNTWAKVGDTNSKFFYAQTKQRRTRNQIIGLYNPSGVWVSSDKDVEHATVNYFEDLFKTTHTEDGRIFWRQQKRNYEKLYSLCSPKRHRDRMK